jgi:ribosomal protein S18 acetylase RimI-like enzyme
VARDLLQRAWQLDRAIDERAARRIERLDGGIAFFSEDLPSVYDANLLRVDRGLDELDPDSLEQLVESVQSDLDHRKLILPDGTAAERLARTLGRRGWQLAPTDVMEYAGPRERDPKRAAEAEEVEPRAIRGARMEALGDRSVDVQRQVAEFTERLGRAGGGRVFAAFADGEVAAFCVLLEGDGLGEIDEVTTLERFRRRGLGTAVVEAALATSLAAGHEATFLVAATSDWPREWYARLGFRTIGKRWEVYKT